MSPPPRHRKAHLRDTAWDELIGRGERFQMPLLDARQEGDFYRRVVMAPRRRRWMGEGKARRSFEEGANISEVARRNGVDGGTVQR
jgi:hypothetical protein